MYFKLSRGTKALRWLVVSLASAYVLSCCFLFLRQRQLIYRPGPELSLSPNSPDFGLRYEDVIIPMGEQESIHGWWVPADKNEFSILPDEPVQVLSSPRTILYLCGVGNNMGDYNYLARVSAFRQLGFSVLVFDYRGYGLSEGAFPNEAQLYEDAEAAWQYLLRVQKLSPEQILIYGESMGGAIALNLATNHPETSGLIMQSSFTSMANAIISKPVMKVFPISLILSEKFDSLTRIRQLKIPVLFLHGMADSVVPAKMSRQLHAAAPGPKQITLIPEADHVSIYRPGKSSYLKAIEAFADATEPSQ